MIAGNLAHHPTPVAQLKLGVLDRCARSFLLTLLARLQVGRLELTGDGERSFGNSAGPRGLHATVEVRDARVYREVASGGTLGAAEAYIRGHWDCDNLTGLMRIILRNQQTLAGIDGVARRWRAPLTSLWHRGRRNSLRGSRQNIAAHYDLGNEFFALFLDDSLSYSCGVFPTPTATMAEASAEKYDRICRTLNLSPADHVLEIGTGWGAFALHAATRYGCRVTTTTISQAQHEVACRRVRAAGLANCVTVLRQDYRALRGRFDKLVSIEMIEAVGYSYLDEYFECCRRLVKPEGTLLLQAILMSEQNFDAYRSSVDFIQRYIFPGGFLPSLGAICRSVGRATDLGLVHYEDITEHYPRTLRYWQRRFREQAEELTDLGYPVRFQRMWDYYFSYCEAAFLERHVTCAQLLLAGPRSEWPGIQGGNPA